MVSARIEMSVGVSEARRVVGAVAVSVARMRLDGCVAVAVEEVEVDKFSEEGEIGNA